MEGFVATWRRQLWELFFRPHPPSSTVVRPRPQGQAKEFCYCVVCPLGIQCDHFLFIALKNAALCHE